MNENFAMSSGDAEETEGLLDGMMHWWEFRHALLFLHFFPSVFALNLML
jgi:hypothetical protein